MYVLFRGGFPLVLDVDEELAYCGVDRPAFLEAAKKFMMLLSLRSDYMRI